MQLYPELDLLIASGLPPSPPVQSRIATLLSGPLDWRLVCNLAESHGNLPALARVVDRCEIRAAAAAKTMRGLWMAAELTRIHRALESAAIPAIAFKGPALAHLAYGNLALRDSADLDIFVPRSRLECALAILAADGYDRKSEGGNTALSGEFEIALRCHNPDCEVDLHWQFSPPYFLPFDAARAMERSVILRTAGFTARTLCPEDLLLYLCIHSARECWANLRFLCDVPGLIARCPLDWDDVAREAERSGCWRVLAAGLQLTHEYCAHGIPPEIWNRARRDRAATRIAGAVRSNLRRQVHNYTGAPGGALLHLRMIGSVRRKARYLCRRAFQPNHLDAEWISLPRRLSAAYYLLRPLRVACAALGRLHG